jgi:hypothetical protein
MFQISHTTIFGTPHYKLFTMPVLPKIRTCTDKISPPHHLWQPFIFARQKSTRLKRFWLTSAPCSCFFAALIKMPKTALVL